MSGRPAATLADAASAAPGGRVVRMYSAVYFSLWIQSSTVVGFTVSVILAQSRWLWGSEASSRIMEAFYIWKIRYCQPI